MNLDEGQFHLSGLTFGAGTKIPVESVSLGQREWRTHDRPVAHGDGRVFGRDEAVARTIAFHLFTDADTPVEASNLEASVSEVWRASTVRPHPGAVLTMRARGVGSTVTKRIYGRPRPYSSSIMGTADLVVPITCDFAAVDDLFYGDDPARVTVTRSPDVRSGLGGPWHDPLGDNAGTITAGRERVHIGGDVPTSHIRVEFHGPVTNPTVEIVGLGAVQLHASLSSVETATIRVHHAFRSVTVDDRPAAGQVSGIRLSRLQLPPGLQEVRFHGLDPTGTSSMTVTVHPAFVSL